MRRGQVSRRLTHRRPAAAVSDRDISTARALSSSLTAMSLYALVASDCEVAVDLFPTRDAAEAALAQVLDDEPAFATLLSVVRIDGAEEVNPDLGAPAPELALRRAFCRLPGSQL